MYVGSALTILLCWFSFAYAVFYLVCKALLREQETRHAVEDAEIKGLELQAQKEMLQQVIGCSLGLREGS